MNAQLLQPLFPARDTGRSERPRSTTRVGLSEWRIGQPIVREQAHSTFLVFLGGGCTLGHGRQQHIVDPTQVLATQLLPSELGLQALRSEALRCGVAEITRVAGQGAEPRRLRGVVGLRLPFRTHLSWRRVLANGLLAEEDRSAWTRIVWSADQAGIPPSLGGQLEPARTADSEAWLRRFCTQYESPDLFDAFVGADAAAATGHCLEEMTGFDPQTLLRRIRLHASLLSLEASEASIGRIALSCGFSSLSAYADYFRRRTGLTPARMRRRLQPRHLRPRLSRVAFEL